VDKDVSLLSDAKSPVSSLILDSGVPPAVKVEDMVCSGEVQPEPACFERENE